jgi:hypothetical protein
MVFLYMRRSIALWRHVHRPPLDDIPAVGILFSSSKERINDVDNR